MSTECHVLVTGMAEIQLTPHQVRLVACEAVVDPRTVVRCLLGKSSHSTTRQRVLVAIEKLGFDRSEPTQPEARP